MALAAVILLFTSSAKKVFVNFPFTVSREIGPAMLEPCHYMWRGGGEGGGEGGGGGGRGRVGGSFTIKAMFLSANMTAAAAKLLLLFPSPSFSPFFLGRSHTSFGHYVDGITHRKHQTILLIHFHTLVY